MMDDEMNILVMADPETDEAPSSVDRLRPVTDTAMIRSEEKYRLITENSADLICLLDRSFRFIYVSPSFKKVLGHELDGLIRSHSFDLVHDEDVEMLRGAFKEAYELRQGRTIELRLRTSAGAWRVFESTASYICGEDPG